MNLFETIRELVALPSASGLEETCLPFYQEFFAPYTEKVFADSFGNIKTVFGEGGIFLDAHTDKLGFIVTQIDDQGFLHAAPVGSVDTRVLPAADFTVYGKKPLYAVAASTPPHLGANDKKAPKAENLLFDLGLSAKEARKMVSPGDRILFRASTERLHENLIVSPYLDNSAGVAVCLLVAAKLHACGKLKNITFCFSAQEEVGLRGASAALYGGSYSELIVTDVGFARAPGIRPEKAAKRSGGPMIGFSPVLTKENSRQLVALAEKMDLPFSYDIMGGKTGTNADVLGSAFGGAPISLVSIPITNMHTPNETVDLHDIDDTANLLTEYIIEKGNRNEAH